MPHIRKPFIILCILVAVSILFFMVKSYSNSWILPKLTTRLYDLKPSPAPTGIPIEPEKEYANPFDEKTHYTNPFSDYKNPFDTL